MEGKIISDPVHGFLRYDPTPSIEEVDRYYRDEFYARADTSYTNDSSLENMAEEAEFHRRSYADLLHMIGSGWSSAMPDIRKATAIDVGCGYGFWLKYLNDHGIAGYGVEPVLDGVDYCKQHGVDAYCLSVEKLAHPPRSERVQLVTMLNVLEHLREPAAVLQQFRDNWLVPGGSVLIRVPNDFNSWQVTADSLLGLGQWWVVPPRHLNYFSAESLTRLLANCGYDVVDGMSTFPLELFLLMGDVYVGDPVLGKQCHRRRVAFERNLDNANHADLRRQFYRQLAKLGLGREIILLARLRQ